ncbi:MAG: electron transport complex subunit RsxC [Candidatus Omnitrophica bacterium]|nr:electron transport complex subunit RsxC [Candidatus Omnitrophota bacterium]
MVRLEEHKSRTEHKKIEALPASEKVFLPTSQHLGKICIPQVQVGDSVSVGQKIASVEAHVTSPIHSSVSGKVASIQDWPHPVLGKCKAIVIDNDGQDTHHSPFTTHQPEEINKLTPEQIRNTIFEAGIVGMGGASFPTHIKLNPPKPVDTLIINGAECEPYLTGDNRLMIEKTQEIIFGIELVKRCTGVKNIYVAIEDNKPEAISAFSAVGGSAYGGSFQLKVLKSNYPQGGEKQLIKNVLNKEVPQGKLPFDIGVVVQNVATVFAIYEAVYNNKPLYERIVTVTGSCLANPKNLLVRLGTPIKNLIDSCGPLQEEPAKIIMGGPMMGITQYTSDAPIIKSSGGVVLLNKKEAKSQEEEFCIRCGACVRECPAGLMPCLINLASEKEIWTEAKALNAMDCIECGLCNYVCPANRRLTQSIRRAKLEASR